MEEERRHGYRDLSDKIGILERDVAVIKDAVQRTAGIGRLLLGNVAALAALIGTGLYGYGQLTNRIVTLDLGTIESDISTALIVVADHGSELKNVRSEQFRIRGVLDDMTLQFKQDLNRQTNDRYRRSDWATNKIWLDEKFANIHGRILHLEAEHHRDIHPEIDP